MSLRWYVARTEPRAEFLAANELSRDGFQTFFPRVKSLRARMGRAYEPLFPGYLFLRIDPDSGGWPSFRPGHRIVGWVSFGGEAGWLPDPVVGELMDRVKAINTQGGLWRRFRPGEIVKVTSHNLEGLAQVVQEGKSPHARVRVLMQLMGRLVQAQVPWQNLLPMDGQPPVKLRSPRRTRGRGRWVRGFGPAAAADGLS